MFTFVKKFLGKAAYPIGVDLGSDSVKIAQVAKEDNEWKLIAAATADIPPHARSDMPSRLLFLNECIRELLGQSGFQGRRAVIGLPSVNVYYQHLRLPKMDDEGITKAIPWEAKGKLPINPNQAYIRHKVAGDVFVDQDVKSEVIVMAASREIVKSYLDMATRAKLDVIGMSVEPQAILDCFSQVYRRKSDSESTACYIDIGNSGTRAYVAREGQIRFARTIPIGGDQLTRAVSKGMGVDMEQARLMRWQMAENATETTEPSGDGGGFAALDAALAAGNHPDSGQNAMTVEKCLMNPTSRLSEELDLCRRYYESTFPNKPVDRLLFIGGEAKNRWLCQQIARSMGIAAQVGDPMARLGRMTDLPVDSGIDRRQPQPNWAVAVGLSMNEIASAENGKQAA